MVDGESKTRTNGDFRMTQVLIDRATLEQLVVALDISQALLEYARSNHHAKVLAAYTAGRAALTNAERVEPDTQRLNFMFLYDAFLSRTKTDADTIAYQLHAQDEDENYMVLSGEDKFFPTGRAAIDAAREKAKQ